MRTSISVGLVSVCLGLAGCGLFGKRQGGSGGSRPFLGASPAPAAPAASGAETVSIDSAGPPPGASGLLAGQVVDRFNRRPSKVYIQVVDLQEPKAQPAARLEVESQPDGYFVVQGLKPGRHYRLIARAKEGEKVLAGSTLAMPPNPRLSIFLSEELASGDTPPVPDPPSVPGTRGAGGDNAALDPPVKTRPGETPPKNDVPAPSNPTGAIWAPARGAPPLAPDRIAHPAGGGNLALPGGGNNLPGWGPSPPKVEIPGQPPSPILPPAPPWNSQPATPAPSSPPASPPDTTPFPGVHLPSVSTPVPSCVVVGRRVVNFALNDLNLEPWEYRRHKRGTVVLIDFWFSSCGPCREAIGHLVRLDQTYRPYGLEIIGIAYEQGAPADQVAKVRAVRARYGINYTTLLGSGMSCPVKTQLRVEKFPTLVLLDENGQIVWHSGNEGIADEYTKRDLDTEIRRRLGVR